MCGCRGFANSSSVLPVSTSFPRSITATRSAKLRTRLRSWVMSRIAIPVPPGRRLSSSWRSSSSLTIRARTVRSSAVVGSSAISSLGWQASAMAIIARWRCPPES